MHYGKIITHDIANGPGCRITLFVSGCTKHCKGCFNQDTWDFQYGSLYNESTEKEIIDLLKPTYISGLTILGGEPMHPYNLIEVDKLVRKTRDSFTDKSIWIYSGYTLEELLIRSYNEPSIMGILRKIDVLVDGEFREDQKFIKPQFKGSANQRIIDMKRTFDNGCVVLFDLDVM